MSPDSKFPAFMIAFFSAFVLTIATGWKAAAEEQPGIRHPAASQCPKPLPQKLGLPGKLRNLDVSLSVDGFTIDGNRTAFVPGRGWTIGGALVDPLEGAFPIKDAKLVFHGSTAEIQVLDSQSQLTGEPRTKWQTAAKFEHFSAGGDQALTFSYYELGSGQKTSFVYDRLFPPVPERDRLIHTVHMFQSAQPLQGSEFGPQTPVRRAPARASGAPILIDPSARESIYESFGCGTSRVILTGGRAGL